MKNIERIFAALRIDPAEVVNFGPYFRQASRNKNEKDGQGLQIDLLIQRKGNVLTLIECKCKEEPIGLGVIQEIERKIKFLKLPLKVSLERVLISCSGITVDLKDKDYFNKVLGIDIFF